MVMDREENKYPRLGYLANDNAFLNYGDAWFQQRTLTARFEMNESKPYAVRVLRKPSINAMALLSFVGDEIYRVEGLDRDGSAGDEEVGLIASSSSSDRDDGSRERVSLLLYNSNDTRSGDNVRVEVSVDGFEPSEDARFAVYSLSHSAGDAVVRYMAMGSPPCTLRLSWRASKRAKERESERERAKEQERERAREGERERARERVCPPFVFCVFSPNQSPRRSDAGADERSPGIRRDCRLRAAPHRPGRAPRAARHCDRRACSLGQHARGQRELASVPRRCRR